MGPSRPGPAFGRLGLAPSFSADAARAFAELTDFELEVASVRLRLIASDGRQVRDTVAAFPAGQDTLTLELSVPLLGSEQTFSAQLELLGGDGLVLFAGERPVTVVAGLLPSAAPQILLSYAGPGRDARSIAVKPPEGTLSAGSSLAVTAVALDAEGRTVPDLLVRWTSSDTSLATVTGIGSATGKVRGSGKRGAVTISAVTPTGLTASTQVALLPPPTSLALASGSGQTGVAGHTLPVPVVVELLAADGLPVPGARVAFAALTPGDSVGAAIVKTDAEGRASTTLTLGLTTGSHLFEATSGDLLPVRFSATATPGAPSRLLLRQTLPATIVVGAGDSVTMQAFVADANGVPVATPGVVVTATGSVTPAPGTPLAITATTDDAGVATFTFPPYIGPVGTATFTLASPGLAPLVSPAITILAGRAVALALTTQPPTSASSGLPLQVQPVVQLVDAGGNPVRAAGVQVTASVSPSSGALVGVATAATDSGGAARFAGLSILGAAGAHRLLFWSSGLPAVASTAIDLLAARLAIGAASGACVAGATSTQMVRTPCAP